MPSDPVRSDPVPTEPMPTEPSTDAPPDVQRDGGPAERQRMFEQERGIDPDDASNVVGATDDEGRIGPPDEPAPDGEEVDGGA